MKPLTRKESARAELILLAMTNRNSKVPGVSKVARKLYKKVNTPK
jgi:hypothetical protein